VPNRVPPEQEDRDIEASYLRMEQHDRDLDLRERFYVAPLTAAAHLKVSEYSQRLIDATDAERECRHGRLPGDRNQTCDCWKDAA
jgi:hypothetical protein